FKLKLVRTDLRASYGPQEVKIQLPWVRWATGGANSIFYCAGGREHRLMTRGADIPVPGTDRPPAAAGNLQYICAGHHRLGDKFFRMEITVDKAGVLLSSMQRFEYDPALGREWPVSSAIAMTATTAPAIGLNGGPDLPIS